MTSDKQIAIGDRIKRGDGIWTVIGFDDNSGRRYAIVEQYAPEFTCRRWILLATLA